MLAHYAELANANQALEKCSKLWLIQQKERRKIKISSNVSLLSKCVLFTHMRATEQNRWRFCWFLSFSHLEDDLAAGFDLKKEIQVNTIWMINSIISNDYLNWQA